MTDIIAFFMELGLPGLAKTSGLMHGIPAVGRSGCATWALSCYGRSVAASSGQSLCEKQDGRSGRARVMYCNTKFDVYLRRQCL